MKLSLKPLDWITFPRFLLLVLFVSQWHIFAVRLENNDWKEVLPPGSDAIGYYMYLPDAFIQYGYPYKPWETNQPDSNSTQVNRYFLGTALAELPFFLASDLLVQQFRFEQRTGYSAWYITGLSIAALSYLTLGLVSLFRLLKRLGFSEMVTVSTLATLFFGTNLYYYALQEPGMSHIYSFGLVSFFLLLLHKQIGEFNTQRMFGLVFLITLITFIRPVNLVFSLSLFPLAGSIEASKTFLIQAFKKWKLLLLSLLIPASFFFLQAAHYFAQTQQWWVYSYGNETFDFLNPQIFNLLFSFRKGWLIYTPVLFLIAPGIIFYFKQFGRFSGITLSLLLSIFIYVTASWWCWWYGGSFGSRPFVDLLPFCAILLASLYKVVASVAWKRFAISLIVGVCVFLNLFQTWQFVNSILPFDEMDQLKYSKIFLKNGEEYRFLFEKDNIWIKTSFPQQQLVWNSPTLLNDSHSFYTSPVGGKDSIFELVNLTIPAEIFSPSEIRMLQLTMEAKLSDLNSKAALITRLGSCDYPVFWNKKLLIAKIEATNQWQKVELNFPIQEFPGYFPELYLALHQTNESSVGIRNLNFRFLKNKSD